MSGDRSFKSFNEAFRDASRKEKGGSPEDARQWKTNMQNVRKIAPEDNLSLWLARGKNDIFTVTTELTPLMAERILQYNHDNRPPRFKGVSRSVEAYAAAMARGEWQLNGEPIIIASDSSLNDGQHRLFAVLESGVSILTQITFGVARDSRHTVDQGAARTPGNILAMYGEKSTNQLAHALQFVWAYDGGSSINYRPSPDQMMDALDANPKLRDAIKLALGLKNEFRVSAGYIAGAIHVCSRTDNFVCNQFVDQVRSGLGIVSQNSPVFRLRKRFMDHLSKKDILPAIEQAALFIKSFNAFRAGAKVRNLTWRRYGPTAEDFPRAG